MKRGEILKTGEEKRNKIYFRQFTTNSDGIGAAQSEPRSNFLCSLFAYMYVSAVIII
jgi:hypothetical protein